MQASELSRWIFLVTGFPLLDWLSGWAGVVPIVALVPAFLPQGVGAGPRAAVGLSLCVVLLPEVVPHGGVAPGWSELVLRFFRGCTLAVSASIAMWTAQMVGALWDELRGARDSGKALLAQAPSGPLGTLVSLFVAMTFLHLGGASLLLGRLAASPLPSRPVVLGVVENLTAGVSVALALATPLLVTQVLLEVTLALLARAASPVSLSASLAAARAVVLLAVAGLLGERLLSVLALVGLGAR